MNLQERNERIRLLYEEAHKLCIAKGEDYSRCGAFDNFEQIALRTNSTPKHVLMVFLTKHLLNIESGVSKSEPLRQRIIDAINYLALLEAMLANEEEKIDIGTTAKDGVAYTTIRSGFNPFGRGELST